MTRACFALVAMMTMAGCGYTKVLEKRILQAKDAQGRVAYYEVEVSGKAKLAKTSFRAGLYDSEALDALFGGVSGSDSGAVSQTLERHRQEAVNTIAGRYYGALEDPSQDPKDVHKVEERLAVAMRPPYEVSSQDDVLGIAQPGRKYALILSAQASQIEEAIAALVEERETTDTILTAFATEKRKSFIEARGQKEEVDRVLAVLNKVREDALKLQSTGAPAGADRKQYVESVNALLNTMTGVSLP